MGEMPGHSTGATTRSARPNFFHAGGPLPADRPGYVRRGVDERVGALVDAGRWVNLVGAPGTGKTSLLLREADRLREAGALVALIDSSQIAQRDGQDDAARWYYAVAFRLARQLRSGFDLQSWWSENALLAPPQRLLELFRELVLAAPGRRLVLLFDDVDVLRALPQGDLFLQGLRLAFDARTTDPEMARLVVVIAGTGIDQFGEGGAPDLPFAVASEADATRFTLAETLRLGPALGLPRQTAELAMQRIYDWVAGHPALTQCLAQALAKEGVETGVVAAIDRIALSRLGPGGDRHIQAVLAAIEHCITDVGRPIRDRALVTLGRVAKGQRVLLDGRQAAHDRLLRAGALTVSPDGFLLPTSRLLRNYFSAGWANRRMPIRYAGLAKAAALLLVLVGLPIAYRVYLPQRYVPAMAAAGATPEAVMRAHDRMARWPGYEDAARDVAIAMLSRAARAAQTPAELDAAVTPLEDALGASEAAAAARRAFWQSQLARAERAGDRPGAVLAAIAALEHGAESVRARLASLIGSDLPELTGVLATGAPFDTLTFRPRDGRLITLSGTAVNTWRRPRGTAVVAPAREAAPLALASQPVVVRFELPARRRDRAPELVMTTTHPRPSDIEVTVTTPTGRSETLPPVPAGVEGPRLALPLADVEAFRQAMPAGGWTVALSDVRPGARGNVADIALAGVAPTDAVPSIALPDPEPASAASLTVDGLGEHAIAWPAAEGNRVTVWDLRAEDIEASFAVSPGTRLLGLVNGDREALIIDGVTLSTRRLSDGALVARKSLQRPVSSAWASGNGRWLAAQEAERDARLFVIDLLGDALVATIGAGVAHERVRVSDDGRFVAAADADRTLRVWRVEDASPVAGLQVDAPVRELAFSPTATHVLAQLTGGGMLAWRFDSPTPAQRWGGGADWSLVEDAQSGLSLIGSARDGFRVHDFVERRDRSLPLLGAGRAAVLRVRDNLAVVAAPDRGIATLWRPRLEALPTGTSNVQRAWLSDDGRAFAFTDRRDVFTVLRLDAGTRELEDLDAGVMTVAHAEAPEIVRMSADGRYALSVEPSGLFRVRDMRAGTFFDFIGRAGGDIVDARFSADGERFVLLKAQSVTVYSTATGRVLSREYRDVPMTAVASRGDGWILSDADGQLFAQPRSDDGVPAALEPLRIDVAPDTEQIASGDGPWIVTAGAGGLQLVDTTRRAAVGAPVAMPDDVRELRFADDGRHVVVRAGHWLVRLRAGGFGLTLTDVRLLPADMLSHSGFALADERASGVTLLRGRDEPEPATVWFDFRDVAPVSGSAESLAARWRLLAPLVRSVPVPAFE